jgi:hypothetical protein
MAFRFDTSQGRVNAWRHQLSTVFKRALGPAPALPAREPQTLEQTLALCGAVDCLIAGPERRVHRPTESPTPPEQ